METNAEVRRRNLEVLITEAGGVAALSQRAGVDLQYLCRLRAQAADEGGESVIDAQAARGLEEAAGKPRGWMDCPDSSGDGDLVRQMSVVLEDVRAALGVSCEEMQQLAALLVANVQFVGSLKREAPQGAAAAKESAGDAPPCPASLRERVTLALEWRRRIAAPGERVNQTTLAEACGVAPPSVCDWFNGETKSIRAGVLFRAARYLGVDPQWLAGEADV